MLEAPKIFSPVSYRLFRAQKERGIFQCAIIRNTSLNRVTPKAPKYLWLLTVCVTTYWTHLKITRLRMLLDSYKKTESFMRPFCWKIKIKSIIESAVPPCPLYLHFWPGWCSLADFHPAQLTCFKLCMTSDVDLLTRRHNRSLLQSKPPPPPPDPLIR